MTAPGPGLVRAVDRFAGTRVVVLGDAMLDSYLHGVPRALCREAPVPILDIAFREDTPGGAANTALNLAALGADVSLIALLGADEEGELVRTALERDGVDTSMLVVDEGRRTLLKQRVLASDQMLARCDMGTTRPAGAQSLDAIRRRLRSSTLDAEAIVVSDYG